MTLDSKLGVGSTFSVAIPYGMIYNNNIMIYIKKRKKKSMFN